MASIAPPKKEQKLESWHRNCMANFPTEVLNLMTGYLNGFSILSLYNCGSGLLNYKLRKNGAVTHFRVRCHADVFPPYRDWRNHNFHSLALFQSLQTLEFLGFSNYAFRYFCTPIIERLSPTIQVIRFDFIESLTMWVNVTKFPRSANLFEPFPIGEQFPNLRVLELRSRFWDRLTIYKGKDCVAYTWTPSSRAAFLSCLPASLSKLTISANGCPSDFPTHLPPNLDTLTVDASHEAPTDWIVHLNPSIRHLVVTGTTSGPKIEEMKLLPRDLEVLHLNGLRESPEQLQQLQNPVPEFPHLLKELRITDKTSWIGEEVIKTLPSTLTTLCLSTCSNALKDDVVQHFPRSLTHLYLSSEIAEITDISHLALMDLPGQLRLLNLASKQRWPWSCFEMLPHTLEYLAHRLFEPSENPDDPSMAPQAALAYWKRKTPPGCQVVTLSWFAGEDLDNHQNQ